MYGYVSGLPAFLAYFGTGVALIIVFALLYSLVTPHRELTLVREGNTAAATAYLGALVGFSLPLTSAAACTRLRPPSLAAYRASSARCRASSTPTPVPGRNTKAPMLALMPMLLPA